MLVNSVLGISGLIPWIVVHCPSCDGWWLDKGELEAIQEESLPVFLLGMARYLADLVR